MNAPTFTAAPWRSAGHRAIAAGTGLDTVTICEVWSGGVGIDQADANEALIAAAPELFDAASEVCGLIDCGFLTMDGVSGDAKTACKRVVTALFAALAKAAGRAES
ncbi:MAG: hypothetical protein IV103_05070 [Zoogloea sp.]|nr:hypothetical protein [Zoogloea sp.]